MSVSALASVQQERLFPCYCDRSPRSHALMHCSEACLGLAITPEEAGSAENKRPICRANVGRTGTIGHPATCVAQRPVDHQGRELGLHPG